MQQQVIAYNQPTTRDYVAVRHKTRNEINTVAKVSKQVKLSLVYASNYLHDD